MSLKHISVFKLEAVNLNLQRQIQGSQSVMSSKSPKQNLLQFLTDFDRQASD